MFSSDTENANISSHLNIFMKKELSTSKFKHAQKSQIVTNLNQYFEFCNKAQNPPKSFNFLFQFFSFTAGFLRLESILDLG